MISCLLVTVFLDHVSLRLKLCSILFPFFGVSVYRHRTTGQTANSEADKHTRMIIITYNTGHAYLLLSFFSFLFVD